MPEAFDAQFPVSSTRLRPSVFGRRAHRRTQEKNSATQGTLSSAEAILESLSNNDGDGDDSENVTEKVKSRGLKVNRAYSISFDSSKVGKFFWSLILKDCIKEPEKKKETCFLVFPSSTNREIRHLHVCSRATTAKKCAKTRGARAKLLFAKKTYCFFAVLVAVAVVDA